MCQSTWNKVGPELPYCRNYLQCSRDEPARKYVRETSSSFRNRCQISLLILGEFKRIN